MKVLLTTKKFNNPIAFFAFSTLSFKNMFFKDNANLNNKMAMYCAKQHMAQWS
ncbi:hypothetical protein [Spiroplasma floricola]|uniref:Uncharacterized protein n=1 Tax=Spiroplasma floricola 23-6 TaxID=1336749 RepID=A0A2K8SEJ8_9MOLU|nr:hypothetical protein [Spiroplasma floricola]AUB31876.1 hypothetical protein SFLOR_v1c08280 [Spiroplasma floricola 23-6]